MSAFSWSCVYIGFFFLNPLSGGKSCSVAPGVAVPSWATETVLSPWMAADEAWVSHVLPHVVWWKKRKRKKICLLETECQFTHWWITSTDGGSLTQNHYVHMGKNQGLFRKNSTIYKRAAVSNKIKKVIVWKSLGNTANERLDVLSE